jgi:hypothetical protein
MAIPENLYGADGLKTGFDGVISTMQLASWAESQRARVDEKLLKAALAACGANFPVPWDTGHVIADRGEPGGISAQTCRLPRPGRDSSADQKHCDRCRA